MSDSSTPRFLQGLFAFKGAGFETLAVIDDSLTLTVPDGSTLQAVYFRGGNSSDEMITIALMHDGKPVRYFPIAAQGGTCLLYTSPSPRDVEESRMPSSA